LGYLNNGRGEGDARKGAGGESNRKKKKKKIPGGAVSGGTMSTTFPEKGSGKRNLKQDDKERPAR